MLVKQQGPGKRPGPNAGRVSEVWQRLEKVVDPELDEPVTKLDFVTHVDVDDEDRVKIGFRLPTYWCAANFAFMMVDDLRSATRELPWVRAVTVELGEHMYADTINKGVAEGQSFQEAFGDEADGTLDEVRRTFLLKAFQRRQEALILHLSKAAAYGPEQIVSLSIDALPDAVSSDEGRTLVERYLERRAVAGSYGSASLAFVTTADEPLQVEGFDVYVRGLRRVRVNAEFNGALCRGLLAVRFDTETAVTPKAACEPQHG